MDIGQERKRRHEILLFLERKCVVRPRGWPHAVRLVAGRRRRNFPEGVKKGDVLGYALLQVNRYGRHCTCSRSFQEESSLVCPWMTAAISS